jgi:hypothetical protein
VLLYEAQAEASLIASLRWWCGVIAVVAVVDSLHFVAFTALNVTNRLKSKKRERSIVFV